MTSTATDLILRYYTAFNTRDWAAYDDLFTPDCTLLATGMAEPLRGVAGVLAFDQGYVATFPDVRIDSLARITAGDTVASENTGSGTMLGELPGPSGPIPPTGEHGEVQYVGVFDVVDGRIAAQRVYLDRLQVLETTHALATMSG